MQRRAEQFVQEQIAVGHFRSRAVENQFAPQSGPGGGGGSLAAMIGLHRAGSDEGVRALRKCVADEKFQFARLVAAEREAGLIIALDP